MTYIRVRFGNSLQEVNEILIALLSELEYEGFEEEKGALTAFISQSFFSREALDRLIGKFNVTYTLGELPEKNWNREWESHFEPVTVQDFCAVRAEFHDPVKNVKHEIVITPKMSFGTGHHPTTFLMISQMQYLDFTNKKVLDFGTGTGILAILAAKLGADSVLAIDNDKWSIKNAAENVAVNNAAVVELREGDTPGGTGKFDIILANITRNVIIDNFSSFVYRLAGEGILLLSGLLTDDEDQVVNEAGKYDLVPGRKTQQQGWICLEFRSR